jgi:polyferredoxin
MIFSEFFAGLHERLKKYVNKKFIQMSAPRRATLARVLFHLILLPASVFLSFVFISYFVTPLDLLHRLLRLDVTTAGGIAGATTTILTFLDFAFLRLKFCTTVCPYGYLQGFLSDDHTLLVHYRDETKECIECKKCIRVCPMDIDIRTSPYQIECVHCADCVDACNEIMGKLGKKGLIHYTWGEQGAVAEKEQTSWVRRLGLRDGKRAVVLFVLLFYAIGLTVALSMRNTIQVQLSPDRTVLFKALPDGRIANHFRLRIANRGHQDAHLKL